MKQTTDKVLMVRPCSFGYNEETAVNNAFQTRTGGDVQAKALAEFDAYVALLRSYGVGVEVVDDTPSPLTPDSVFPNNWFSLHEGGTLVLYPMFAQNRRKERKQTVVDRLLRNYNINSLIDLTPWEDKGLFLEGTGSMVLDRAARIAYACLSPRTDLALLHEWCGLLDYEPVAFRATDAGGVPWYHTNVMLCLGTAFAVVATESIEPGERERVLASLAAGGREIIAIDRAAVGGFAGNMLELAAWDEALGDVRVLVMSARARAALAPDAWQRLSGCVDSVLVVPVPTIEEVGGGGVRCMLAEVGAG